MNKKTNKKNRGFSLVELIIVIAIMAILAGVLAPQFVRYIGKSRISSDIQSAQMMSDAISAQISDDATSGTTTTGLGIPAKTTTGDAVTFGNISAVGDVVGGKTGTEIKTKHDSAKVFYYEINEKGNVSIYAGATGETASSACVMLSPTPAGDWK